MKLAERLGINLTDLYFFCSAPVVQGGFEHKKSEYESRKSDIHVRTLYEMVNLVLPEIDNCSMLDVACGGSSIKAYYPNTVAMDIRRGVLDNGGVVGDMRHMPFGENSFDIVAGFYIPTSIKFITEEEMIGFLESCIRIARKYVYICSKPLIVKGYHKKFNKRILLEDDGSGILLFDAIAKNTNN